MAARIPRPGFLLVLPVPAAILVWVWLSSAADVSPSLRKSHGRSPSAFGSPTACDDSCPARPDRPRRAEPKSKPLENRNELPREEPVPVRRGVEVRFVRAASGEPLRESLVRIEKKTVTTNDAGCVVIDRRSLFTVSVDGFVGVIVVVEADEASWPQRIVVPLHPAAMLNGTVTDVAGTPVAGSKVVAYLDADRPFRSSPVAIHPDLEGTAVTDAKGRFRIEGLPAGVPIASEAALDRVRLTNEPLILRPGENRSVRWTLPAWGSVRGAVVDQDRRRVAFSRVALNVGNTNQALSTLQADQAGLFQFERVPCGAYRVQASPGRMATLHGADFPPSDAPVQVLGHGSVATVSVRVHRGLYLRGFVVGPDGKPVGGITVTRGYFGGLSRKMDAIPYPFPYPSKRPPCWRDALPDGFERGCGTHDLCELGRKIANSGRDGAFVLGPVGPGSYQVMAWERGVYRDSKPVVARAGGPKVTLRVAKGGLVEGRVVADGLGESWLAGRVWAVRNGSAHAVRTEFAIEGATGGGEFLLQGLEPGRYQLFALPKRLVFPKSERRTQLAGRVGGLIVEPGTMLRKREIRLGPAGIIRVHVNPPAAAGDASSGCIACQVMVGEATIAAAEFTSPSSRVFLVPPATYRIRFRRTLPDRAAHRDHFLTVGPGQEVSVRFP
jgi:hypothetical protein